MCREESSVSEIVCNAVFSFLGEGGVAFRLDPWWYYSRVASDYSLQAKEKLKCPAPLSPPMELSVVLNALRV